jgi:hypothetical protein
MCRKYQKPFIALWLFALVLGSARAQESKSSKPESAATRKVINLWPGVAPGSEEWKQQEVTLGSGGGFVGLSIKSEGQDVAKWLVARGLAAIVLKYRTKQIEGKDAAELSQSARASFIAQLNNHALIAEDGKFRVADGIQAVKVVRAHAPSGAFLLIGSF